MENVILKKINGETKIKHLDDLRRIKSSLIEIDNCFDNIIDKQIVENTAKQEIEDAKKIIYHVINSISTNNSRRLIDDSFEKLKVAKTKKDILNIISDVIAMYINHCQNGNIVPSIIKKGFEPLLKSNPSLVISLFVKKIVYMHYLNIFARISALNVKEIYIASKKNIKEALKMVGDTFPKNARNTGFYVLAEQMFLYNLEIAISRNSKHMCWENCKNASPKQCEKIKDVRKKAISEYPFITDGYQKYNHRGELIDFCVSSCENYEPNFRKAIPLFALGVEYKDLYEGYMNLLRK